MPAHSSADISVELLNSIALSRSSEYPSCLLTPAGDHDLDAAIISMKRDYVKSRAVLKKWVRSLGPTPPLQLLMKLNEEDLLFVTTYLFLMPNRTEQLYDAFNAVYSNSGTALKSAASSELGGVLAQVVNTTKHPDERLHSFFNDVSNRIVELGVRLMDEDGMDGSYLSDILDNYIFPECQKEFVLLNLKQLLQCPSSSSSLDLNAVLGVHSKKWSIQALNTGTVTCIAKIVSLLDSELIVAELKVAANVSPIRWKYFLGVLSVLIKEKDDSSLLVKGLIDEWLKHGLESDDRRLLYLALITVRHCCAAKTPNFPTYINWFGSAQPTNPQHFASFFRFLSDIVPFESPLHLKIHVNKVPAAPTGCQNVLSDYIILAKTRLTDLNETTDYLSVFNKCHDTEQESLSSDVSQLLNHFLATNEIAKPVIEASVFRKQYYERVFLKYLLSLSDKADPTRGRVIRKLNSLGKIPSAMFTSWLML